MMSWIGNIQGRHYEEDREDRLGVWSTDDLNRTILKHHEEIALALNLALDLFRAEKKCLL